MRQGWGGVLPDSLKTRLGRGDGGGEVLLHSLMMRGEGVGGQGVAGQPQDKGGEKLLLDSLTTNVLTLYISVNSIAVRWMLVLT